MSGIERKQFSSRVSLNVVVNLIQTLLTALLGLVMVPYYLGYLGPAIYAMIPLVTSVNAYVMILTIPLGSAISRYVFESASNNDYSVINRTYNSALFGLLKYVILLIPLCIIVSIMSPIVFDTGGAKDADIQLFFLLILLSSLVLVVSSSIGCIFDTTNSTYKVGSIKIVYTVLQTAIIIILFTLQGASLPYIGYAYMIAAAVMVSLVIITTKKSFPELEISRKYYDKEAFRSILNFGSWIILYQFGIMLYIDVSLILCNLLIGSEMQGLFAITANILNMTMTVTTTFSAVVTPLLYNYYTEHDYEGLIKTLNLFIKFIGVLLAFPVVYVLVFLPQLMETWIGAGYEELYPLLYIMLPIQFGVCLIKPLEMVPATFKHVRLPAIATIFFGMINIGLALILTSYYECTANSIAIAWTVSIFALNLIFVPVYCTRLLKRKLSNLYIRIIWSYGIFILVGVVVYELGKILTITSGWLEILLPLMAGYLIYLAIFISIGFNRDERKILFSFLPVTIQQKLKKVIHRG